MGRWNGPAAWGDWGVSGREDFTGGRDGEPERRRGDGMRTRRTDETGRDGTRSGGGEDGETSVTGGE